MKRFFPLPLALLGFSLFFDQSALAVKTDYFKQSSAADFREGTLKNVAVTDRGEIRLSREIKSLLPASIHVGAVTAMTVMPDGGVVIAAFPDSRLLKLKDGRAETLATLKDRTITALACDADGRLLIATAAEQAEVLRIDKAGAEPKTIFKQEGVDFVWVILPQAERMLLATGPESKVLSVDLKGKATELAKLGGENVTALIASGETLYAGTDTEGLVYSIDRKSGTRRLLFDAAESDIVALAIDKAGDLLAAASDATPGVPAAEPGADTGRPETPEADHAKPDAAKPDAAEPELPKPAELTAGVAMAEENAEGPASQPAAVLKHAAGPVQPGGSAANESAGGGNAVYKVQSDGVVSELYRSPAPIFAMAIAGDRVLLGTGDHGDLYELRPGAEEAVVAAHVDGQQINAIAVPEKGPAILAASNAGGAFELSDKLASEGTFESAPLDAGMISAYGAVRVDLDSPGATPAVTLSARTGNAADAESDDWGPWSKPEPAGKNHPKLPAGRYVQYKLAFGSENEKSPAVRAVSIAYQKPNVPPRVASVTVAPAGDPQHPASLSINWTAEDANNDALRYALYYRSTEGGDWVELAKDLETLTYTWPGDAAADGRYEFKVVASDAGANVAGRARTVSRVSSPVVIDNSPPRIGKAEVAVEPGQTTVKLTVSDVGGTMAALDYSIDRANHWQLCLPDDTIADSPEERYTVALKGLVKGRHTLTVRATDENGNTAFEAISVTIP